MHLTSVLKLGIKILLCACAHPLKFMTQDGCVLCSNYLDNESGSQSSYLCLTTHYSYNELEHLIEAVIWKQRKHTQTFCQSGDPIKVEPILCPLMTYTDHFIDI